MASVDPSTLGGRGEEAAVIEAGEGSVAKSVCVEVGLGGLVGCEEKATRIWRHVSSIRVR